MADIFISYRRGGAGEGYSHRLADDLDRRFGSGTVFRDIEDLGIGNFESQLESSAQTCRVMLIVIGPRWLDLAKKMQNPEDWVRREIAAALDRGVPIVPILVGGATASEFQKLELSEPLDQLTRQQAFTFEPHNWEANVDRLVKALTESLGLEDSKKPEHPKPTQRSRSLPYKWIAIGAAVVVVLLAVGVNTDEEPRPNDSNSKSSEATGESQNSNASTRASGLSGAWVDNEGYEVQINHSGRNISVYYTSGIASGSGTIDSDKIYLDVQSTEYGVGVANLQVAGSGTFISGNVSYESGVEYAITANKR